MVRWVVDDRNGDKTRRPGFTTKEGNSEFVVGCDGNGRPGQIEKLARTHEASECNEKDAEKHVLVWTRGLGEQQEMLPSKDLFDFFAPRGLEVGDATGSEKNSFVGEGHGREAMWWKIEVSRDFEAM